MRFPALLLPLTILLLLAACQSNPAEPVGPQDGAVWVDVDVNIPSSSCPDETCSPQPSMPETPCSSDPGKPCLDPALSSVSLLGDPLPPLQYAGQPLPSVALAGPDSLRDAPPWAAYAFLGALSLFLAYAIATRKRRRYSRRALVLPLLLVSLALAGCQMTPVLKADLDEAVETERQVDEAKADTFQKAIADGKAIEVATGEAFGAYVTARPKPGEESDLTLLSIVGLLAGGGVTGTGLVRLLRGTSLKSGSGNGKT